MRLLFSFFLRLFICFLAAKFILLIFESGNRSYLVGLTAVFLANIYLLEILGRRDRSRIATGGRASGQGNGPEDPAER
jgi:hypothetical protein